MTYTCKYCENTEYYFVKSIGKIERYGMYCGECHRMIKWVPDEKAVNIPGNLIREYKGCNVDLLM